MKALGLRARILGAFLLSFSFFLGATALSLFQLDRLGDVLAVIDDGYVPLSRTAAQLEGAVIRVESDLDRIRGANATYVPYYERAVRRSSLLLSSSGGTSPPSQSRARAASPLRSSSRTPSAR